MRLLLAVVFSMLFWSCDPMDDRMTFYNNTDKDLMVRFCFIGEEEIHDTWAGLRPVTKKERKTIGVFDAWESEFEQVKPIQKINVIIYDGSILGTEPIGKNAKVKSDSLLREGNYKYKEYTYQDLVSKKWEIIYPDDGFSEGFPLEFE